MWMSFQWERKVFKKEKKVINLWLCCWNPFWFADYNICCTLPHRNVDRHPVLTLDNRISGAWISHLWQWGISIVIGIALHKSCFLLHYLHLGKEFNAWLHDPTGKSLLQGMIKQTPDISELQPCSLLWIHRICATQKFSILLHRNTK